MTGRLAIDFGTSNTILAVWDDITKSASTLKMPGYSKEFGVGADLIHVIPSLIHYENVNTTWIGNQVFEKHLYSSPRTIRWMKRYIQQRNPMKMDIFGKVVTPSTAGFDFLRTILITASNYINDSDGEVALCTPVESYEHYDQWLSKTASDSGFPRFRLIDEPTAAALGYGGRLQPGQAFVLFDFGGGTIHATVVLVEKDELQDTGRRCRVLGKAGKDLGGTTIDGWIFQDFLKSKRMNDWDEHTKQVALPLLVECEKAKELLSFEETAQISIQLPDIADPITSVITRSKLDELFDQHDLITTINQLLRNALNAARERGYNEDDIKLVLMVGGSSQIPAVQRCLRQFFGKEKVKSDRPFDSVAKGAAAFISGIDFYDHIQHHYAIRYWNPQKGQNGDYDYKTIVEKGTLYPTQEPISRLTIKASNPGQRKLGIAIFEIGAQVKSTISSIELVFDPQGSPRLMPITPDDSNQRSMFWMNENNLTFLSADPPANPGEPRFQVEFKIDQNKHLIITALDLLSGNICFRDFPVIKLN